MARMTSKTRDGQHVTAVHERLREAILSGELEPGASVSQPQLTAAYDVGRTPLREALRLLQREGLVIAAPNLRVRIAPLTAQDFEEITVARLALETVAIRITVPTLTSAEVAALEGFMAQMNHYQHVGDERGQQGPHRAFHRLLVGAAGPRVTAQMAELSDHAQRYRVKYGVFGDWAARHAEHRAILDAVAAGQADLTASQLAAHYLRSVPLVFPEHDLERLRITVRAVAPKAESALGTAAERLPARR